MLRSIFVSFVWFFFSFSHYVDEKTLPDVKNINQTSFFFLCVRLLVTRSYSFVQRRISPWNGGLVRIHIFKKKCRDYNVVPGQLLFRSSLCIHFCQHEYNQFIFLLMFLTVWLKTNGSSIHQVIKTVKGFQCFLSSFKIYQISCRMYYFLSWNFTLTVQHYLTIFVKVDKSDQVWILYCVD